MRVGSILLCWVMGAVALGGAEQQAALSAASPCGEQTSDAARELCLLAQEVEAALRSVCDLNSAEAAARRIQQSRQRMLQALAEIESRHPLTQEEAAHLGDLTRMMQALLPVMTRLREVNAYGSAALMAEMEDYEVDAQDPGLLVENTPQIRLYTAILETMDDMVLALRKIQQTAPGERELASLEAKVRRLHEKKRLLGVLQASMTEEEQEAAAPLKEQRTRLARELAQEVDRIRQKPVEPRLQRVLEACCRELD